MFQPFFTTKPTGEGTGLGLSISWDIVTQRFLPSHPHSKNHDSFFEIWFGAAKANAALVPVNWRLAGPEIAFIVNDAEAEILFVGAEFLDAVAAIGDQLASVRKVLVTDRDYPAWRDRQSAADPDLPMVSGDVCIQMYTSGTTGRPKGAQLTNTNLLTELSLLDTMGEWARWQASDVSLVVMPLFHIAGSGYAMMSSAIGRARSGASTEPAAMAGTCPPSSRVMH